WAVGDSIMMSHLRENCTDKLSQESTSSSHTAPHAQKIVGAMCGGLIGAIYSHRLAIGTRQCGDRMRNGCGGDWWADGAGAKRSEQSGSGTCV
ncbi:MAG: hypothetical protein ACREFR_19285, partial [Limisphaerales bacterium]